MKKVILLLFLLALIAFTGCEKPMTNDQIISEVKKCKDAGLHAHIVQNIFNFEVYHIICEPY